MAASRRGRRLTATALSALALVAAGCGGHAVSRASEAATTTSTTTAPATAPTTGHHAKHHHVRHRHAKHSHVKHSPAKRLDPGVALCPLTGLPAPGGRVPDHAALAVKVENLPESRPQWGVDKADIVFEEPVEGAITRFIAVYDCTSAPRIEPVRSGRFDDPNILEPLGKLLFAYSGAIQPVIDDIDASHSLLKDVGANMAPDAYTRDPDRVAPQNLFTSTAALYAAAHRLGYPEKPPTAIFSYGPPVPGSTPASEVSITSPLDVTTWTYHRDTGLWYRSYSDTGPALQGDGAQLAFSNVIVMLVDNNESPWPEDDTGTHEYVLGLKGSGAAWVFRDGRQYFGRWERPLLEDPAVFVEKNGTRITLTPGTTWEEMVPVGGSGPTRTWTGSVSVKS